MLKSLLQSNDWTPASKMSPYPTKWILTVALSFSQKIGKGSKSNIPPVDDVLSEKCFKGLPLKFHGESNGTKKFFDIQFSICITPEVERGRIEMKAQLLKIVVWNLNFFLLWLYFCRALNYHAYIYAARYADISGIYHV